jgi:hypothetical protein
MKRTTERLTEFLGWYGVVAIIVAYALLSFGVVESVSATYHIINLSGGIGIMIDAYADKNYQPVVLNIIWIGIALYALSIIFFR